MQSRFLGCVLPAVVFTVLAIAASACAAEDYTVDRMHAGITFKISHGGFAWIQGRFNDFSGNFTLDPDNASQCSFDMMIKAESVDTNNSQRDNHLRSPDFFNAKQFPGISFKSTAVTAIKDGYKVTGELTMHGVTKPVTFELMGGRRGQFPPGVDRTGFTAEFPIKRSDFGVGASKFDQALGNEVHATISFEGTKKK
jgi:polyisoprenoid-binding protein YceI